MKNRILIVDPEPKLRAILANVLSQRGYDVQIADNGRKALEIIPQYSPHLVIADVALPEVDGFQLCRRIRSDARFGSLRFIFLSAKNNREAEIEGLALGADDYITKPFDVDKLIARVEARLRWLDTAKTGPACEGSMEGNLSGRNLIDILQILEVGQRTGQLQIKHANKQIEISFSDGVIVRAESAEVKNKQAVFIALALPQGRFCFTPLDSADGREHIEITHLLLEWAQITDDLERKAFSSSEGADLVGEFIRYVKKRENKRE